MSVREHVVFMDVLIRSAGAGDQNSGDCDLVIVVGGGDWDCDSLTNTLYNIDERDKIWYCMCINILNTHTHI